jgi:hypothetical protein
MSLSSLVEKCKKVDLTSVNSFEQLYHLFTSHSAIPSFILPLKEEGFVVRSRMISSGKVFTKVTDFMNPPVSCVTEYSRANKPGQSLFYCADNYTTTYAELMPVWLSNVAIGQEFNVALSFWRNEKPLSVAIIPDSNNPRLEEYFRVVQSIKLTKEELLYWDYINSYFSAQGFHNKSVYKFTAAYCNAIFDLSRHNNSPIDGILYTSVQDRVGWNIVLSPASANRCLHLTDISQHHFMRLPDNGNMPQYQETYKPNTPKSIDATNDIIIW